MTARNFCVAALERLEHGVVDENVLLFGLDQVVALLSNVLKKPKHVEALLVFDLFHHRINHYVRPCAANACTAVTRK